MIRSQTVFVLGAGASQAYRFPDGESLVRLAIGFTETEGMPGKVAELQALGIDEARAQGFRDQLAKSLVESIDAFLETRQEFLDIGKRVIARLLMPLEQPDYLPAREDDWYAYLLNRMIKGSPDDFRANRLSVVTFNFDRSFEWALFTTLQARYGLSDDEAGDLASSVKVIHVHGDLGHPMWLRRSASEDVELYKNYDTSALPQQVIAAANRIRLVSEELKGGRTIPEVHQLLHAARFVYFLGFGYHELNMRKLAVQQTLTHARIYGTVYRMAEGEVGRVRRLNWAIDQGHIERTPFKKRGRPTIRQDREVARSRRLEAEEADRLLAACGPHLRSLVEARWRPDAGRVSC